MQREGLFAVDMTPLRVRILRKPTPAARKGSLCLVCAYTSGKLKTRNLSCSFSKRGAREKENPPGKHDPTAATTL